MGSAETHAPHPAHVHGVGGAPVGADGAKVGPDRAAIVATNVGERIRELV